MRQRSASAGSHSLQIPLVVLTPKSLLRKRSAYGTLDEIVGGRFHEVIDDARFEQNRDTVRRILLCTGKMYHDLVASDDKSIAERFSAMNHTAVVRVELLSPLRRSAPRAIAPGSTRCIQTALQWQHKYNAQALGFLLFSQGKEGRRHL